MEHVVFLALGTNMGNRLANLKAAIGNLRTNRRCMKRRPGASHRKPSF